MYLVYDAINHNIEMISEIKKDAADCCIRLVDDLMCAGLHYDREDPPSVTYIEADTFPIEFDEHDGDILLFEIPDLIIRKAT